MNVVKNMSDRLLLSQLNLQLGKQKTNNYKDYSPQAKESVEKYLKELLAEKELRKL